MRHLLTRGLLLALVLGFFSPTRASAKGIILITHGDTVKEYGPIVDREGKAWAAAQTGRTDLTVGFAYDYFGVFWIDLWTWGGKYVVYSDKQGWEIPEETAAKLLGKSS